MRLHNVYSKEILTRKLEEEAVPRNVLSFYRYIKIQSPEELRDLLYQKLFALNVLGRIYMAQEGINAQVSVPQNKYEHFRQAIDSFDVLRGVDFNLSPVAENPGNFKNHEHRFSFLKLKIKCRKKIVNDGLGDKDESQTQIVDVNFDHNLLYDTDKRGTFLTPQEFNQALSKENSVVIDLRNHYESEVGHFENAVCLENETYRESLKNLPERLKGQEEKQLLLYCTGGIRCEKASLYLKECGFRDVNQLKGGIVSYLREVQESDLPSRFIGKNFVFDERRGEKISSDVISSCHLCGKPSDRHTNCENKECHVLMIQCEDCQNQYDGCCSEECFEINQLPESIQKIIRKGKKNPTHALKRSHGIR